MLEPQVVRIGMWSIQVCVPKDWADERIIAFAEEKYPAGTVGGWHVRKDGDPSLGGDPARNPCHDHEDEKVHVVLDA